jgi:hypothetical protein
MQFGRCGLWARRDVAEKLIFKSKGSKRASTAHGEMVKIKATAPELGFDDSRQ